MKNLYRVLYVASPPGPRSNILGTLGVFACGDNVSEDGKALYLRCAVAESPGADGDGYFTFFLKFSSIPFPPAISRSLFAANLAFSLMGVSGASWPAS